MARHNKKRNAGLLYEFLLRSISRSLVEQDDKKAEKSKKLIKKYFASNTELHKEYRLINALVNVPVGSESLAALVLEEARAAALNFDGKKLRSEKDSLIRDINHFYGTDVVYAESVQNYKEYATASSLVQYWRGEKNLDIGTVTQYKRVLLELLSSSPDNSDIENTDPNVDALVVKIASDKLRKKYESKLSKKQSEILNEYAFGKDHSKLKKRILEICDQACSTLLEYGNDQTEAFAQRSEKVIENIQVLRGADLKDDNISKVMEVLSLIEEITGD